MENNLIEIGEGINLLHIKSNKFKTTNVALLIRRQLDRSEVTKNALIPQLLKRGSNKYPTLSSINIKAEELYGAVFDAVIMKKGEEQIMQFYMEILNETVEKNLLYDGLEFMRDITLDPLTEGEGFNMEFVQSEKENLKRKIESRMNDKKEYAKLRLLEEMCKDEPFGVYGDGYAQDLEGIDNINLYEHYKNVISESPMDFIVIGDCDTEKIAEKLKELFVIKRADLKRIPKAKIIYNPSAEEKNIKEKADISQAKLCIGLRSGFEPTGNAFYELMVMNEAFGGSPDSKLFVNVREKESLCYYVNSFIYRFKTIVLIQSGVDENDYEKAVRLIKEQLEEIRKENIGDDEIEKAKKSLTKKFKGIYDHPQGVMDFYLTEQMLGENGGIDEAIKNIGRVNKKAVSKAAKGVYIDTVYLLSASEEN